jgi:peptidyl-prolyl cis-trans isomerase D
MLRTFRENIKGRMGKVLLAIIIVPFVLFGAESLLTGGGGAATVLEVNGEEIDAQQVAQEVVLLRNEMASRMGEDVDFEQLSQEKLTPAAIQRLTESTLIRQLFGELSLTIPEALLQQTIMQTTAFQVDGKFSSEQMTRVLADTGFNLNTLKGRLAEDIRLGQLRAGILQSGFVTEQNTRLILDIVNETRAVDWVELTIGDITQSTDVSEVELTDYYEASKTEFLTALNVDVEYLLIDREALSESVEESLVVAEYNSQKNEFIETERREIAHILLEINSDQSESDALQKMAEIAEKYNAGTSFEVLAVEYSQDVGSAREGGDLGYAEKDGTFPEEFEEAVFALPEGALSAPVTTDAGIHLITVTDIAKTSMPAFDDIKRDIEMQIQRRSATKEYVRVMAQVADVAFNAADLAEPASAIDGTIESVSGITRTGGSSSSSQGAQLTSQQQQLFSDSNVLDDRMNSEVIELNDGQGVVVRVKEAYEPRQLDFDEVRSQIEIRLLQQTAELALSELAAELVQQVADSGEFTKVMVASGLAPTASDVTRQTRTLPRELLEAIFAASRSNEGKTVETVASSNGTQFLFKINSVSDGKGALDANQQALLEQQSADAVARQELGAYIENLKQSAVITRY